MRAVLALLGGCLTSVWATSQGVATTTCNPWDNMGCNTWFEDNRLNCTDPTKGPMPWAAKPVRSAVYSVRTADGPPAQDPNYYVPGNMMSIYVRALQYNYAWRGILLTAFDSTPQPVGSWVFPADDQAMFWSPPQCNQSAMHNSATPKPYRVLIRFQPPPAGTGTITIRALIKQGPANNGYFYRPLVDLVLQEGYQEAAWYVANAGESCDTCCVRNGRTGIDAIAQGGLFPAVAFQTAVEKKVLCKWPLVSSCSAGAPVIDEDNICYMREANCNSSWRLTTPVNDSRTLCACHVVVSPASVLSINRWLMGALLGLSALTSQKRYLFIYLVIGCALLPTVTAHNWLHTPGRASTQASTVFPCQGRKTTDLHAQVSRNQNFVTKWAVGHDRNSYFVLLNEKDQDMLAQSDFETMVDDYLDKGTKPPYNSPNLATNPTWMRYHGTYATDISIYGDSSKLPGSLFAKQISPSDPNYLTNIRSNQSFSLFEYTDDARKDDIRLQYKSDEYPWIEMAFRAPHLYHIPADFNSFRTQVPGLSGNGHYILHWRWSGYFDCIDIDLRTDDVPNIYGVDGSGYIFNRIDHCQYLTPNQIVTPCVEVNWDVESCIDALPGWMTTARLGINVVPFVNPATVYKGFSNIVNIPWSDGVCASNSWVELQGTVTESFIDFNNPSVFKMTKNVGQMCTSTMTGCGGSNPACGLQGSDYLPSNNMLNFKRAVALCVGHKSCVGLSIEKDSSFAAGTLPTDAGLHHILLCTSLSTTSNSNWTTISPNGLATFQDLANQPVKYYSFVPDQFATGLTPSTNNFLDLGNPYANGMGWKCNASVDCPWCCYKYDCNTYKPSGTNPTNYGSFQWMQGYCDSNPAVVRNWEVAVAAGIYEVKVYSDSGDPNTPNAWVSGCNVEGALMQLETDEPPQPVTLTRRVEVLDGRLTLDGEGAAQLGCNAIHWVSVQLVRSSWNEVWLPAASNPYWMMTLATPQPIGVVQIDSINYYYEVGGQRNPNCAAWWLLRGSKCYDGRPLGWFNASTEGAIVGVSANPSPCGASGCTGTVCGSLNLGVNEYSIGQQYIDCKGATGKYVWVYLPGASRALVVNVRVFRAQPNVPVPLQNVTKVCYGVEAHSQTATNPEFTTTTDPEDPIFYSTCYAREHNITWLGPALTSSAPVPRWRFNEHCLSCDTYHHNGQSLDPTELPAPWNIADGKCANCDIEGTPAPISQTVLPWTFSYRGYCDASIDLNTCNTTNASVCMKQLAPGGRTGNDNWEQQVMSEVDCQLLVERDPECQPVAQFQRAWWNGNAFDDFRRTCQCWKKTACCGRCTAWSWNVPQEGSEVYTTLNSLTPDSSCSTGIKSSDNKMCCPSYCTDATGKSVCGSSASTNCRAGVNGGGGCCADNTVQKCSVTGPPCLLV